MLAFEMEYLMGRSFATDFRDRSEPEWPPHPSRLFSALVAACYETGMGEDAKQALHWLERQPPPEIHAEEAGTPVKVMTYVPTNYPGSAPPVNRNKQPRFLPAVTPKDCRVYFKWPDAAPSPELRTVLGEIASRVPYLGKSSSMVRIALTETPLDPNYVPDPSGSHVLLIAGEGRMTELERLFKRNQWSPQLLQQRYRCLDGEPIKTKAIQGMFSEMIVFRRTGGPQLPVEAALTLSTSTREALMSKADEHGVLTDLLHGHGRHPHCAYVPLPFAGAPHADGRLMGIAVILPRGIEWEERRNVLAACGHLESIRLPKDLGDWSVEISDPEPLAKTLRPGAWTRPACLWSTVTPILLDHFPKRKANGPGIEQIIAASCERVGLPAPTVVDHGPYSGVEGIPPVPQFRLLRDKNDRPRWGVHATLRFEHEVQGPVLLGAGRYFGLGLLKPQGEQKP